MAKKVKFKYLTVIVFEPTWAKNSQVTNHPLEYGEQVLYLGEVPNCPGHCAVAKRNGAVIWLVHSDEFRKAKDEEL